MARANRQDGTFRDEDCLDALATYSTVGAKTTSVRFPVTILSPTVKRVTSAPEIPARNHAESTRHLVCNACRAMENARKTRKLRPGFQGESVNRDGHWTRQFGIRTDPWVSIEGWAAQHGFGLVALKGKRRLYRKRYPSGTEIFCDIRENSGQVVMSGWLEFGRLSRGLHLFFLPVAMNPAPKGWLGIIVRRQACRAFNDLLERFRQPLIYGSQSVHLCDLDPSTLLLAVLLIIPLVFFLAGSFPRFEWSPALLPALSGRWGIPAVYCLAAYFGLVALQEAVAVRYLRERWMKGVLVGTLFIFMASLSLFCLRNVDADLAQTRILYHCLSKSVSAECGDALQSLPARSRQELSLRLQALERNLGVH